jgi:hypothetical protein
VACPITSFNTVFNHFHVTKWILLEQYLGEISGMLRRVVCQKLINVSMMLTTSIIKALKMSVLWDVAPFSRTEPMFQ